jgi:phosphoribosylglycinamide formyltransferase-1
MEKLRLGVLASGRGTNLQAIIDAARSGRIRAEVAVVVADRIGARARERARRAGIPEYFVDLAAYPTKEAFEHGIVSILERHGVELVCLAGYMRILTRVMLEHYRNRIINIHPSLLPAFPGLHAQRQALEYGVRFAGCTVHFVEEEVDAGPIILQAVVPVLPDDTVEALSARILEQEHRIYVEAIQLYQAGRLKIEGRRVRIRPE